MRVTGRLTLAALVAVTVGLGAMATAAGAEVRTYLKTERYGPSEGAGTFGPSIHYPATVDVSGVAGTVTEVTLTVIELTASADLDMALVGPNGGQVMLMSDACASGVASHVIWTFDDDAASFVNGGACPKGGVASVRPTNYGAEPDNLAVSGGPSGPFSNSLAVFDGISPNGAWKLFMLDDDPVAVGFEMPAFALHLDVEPPPAPPPPPPTIVTVEVPVPVETGPTRTGKRARALAKCKRKPSGQPRKRCRAKAKKLPL